MGINKCKVGKEYSIDKLNDICGTDIKSHTTGWHIENTYVMLFLTLDKEIMENDYTDNFSKMTTSEKRQEIHDYIDYFDIVKKIFHWEAPTMLNDYNDDLQAFIKKKKKFHLFVREYYKKNKGENPCKSFFYCGPIKYLAHDNKINGRGVIFQSKLEKIDKKNLGHLYNWRPKDPVISSIIANNVDGTRDTCAELIIAREGLHHEYKKFFFGHKDFSGDDDIKSRCLEYICAMFNQYGGGKLIIGVRDDSKTSDGSYEVTGIEEDMKFKSEDKYKDSIVSSIRSAFKDYENIISCFKVFIHRCENGKHICVCEMDRMQEPVRFRGHLYRRGDARTERVQDEAKFIANWEDDN